MNNNQHNAVTTHVDRVFDVAKHALCGFLSGPNFNILLTNAMSGAQRLTLGDIVVNDAWDMAETLVTKYEAELSKA